ncbi:type VII secretion protein EccB [Streptomyces canus]|uniref:type VII secretion protein EccB n=1 Tax=Streptomyces canus TaxID=58343 RepID=UPI0033E38154
MMQNRRDQVQAHQFVVSRLTSGLLRADPDAPETPTRRTNRGVLAGTLLSVILCIGFLVYGFIRPGGATSWRDGGTLLIEKGTGTRYLYDGTLRPVRNYASARLIVGAGMTTDDVSSASLAGTTHGSPVGIEGAPDSYPAAGDLDKGPWEVCAATKPTESGGLTPSTTLVVDARQGGVFVQKDQAVLVKGGEGDASYLLWQGNRFKLASGASTADALGYGAATPLRVSAAFLDSLPAGHDLARPDVPGQGERGPELDGMKSRVGQVFTVKNPGSAQHYYLLERAGLVPITTTQAALALSSPGVRDKAYAGSIPTAVPLSVNGLSGALAPAAQSGKTQEVGKGLPASPPKLVPVGDGTSVCERLAPRAGEGTEVSLMLVDSNAVAVTAVPAERAMAQALLAPCLAIDSISVPPSGGSLVRVLGTSGGTVGTTTYLVTDAGVKYRIPTDADAKALGFTQSASQSLPSPLLNMLPTGPDLTQQAALAGRSTAEGTPSCSKHDSASVASTHVERGLKDMIE